MSEIVGQSMAVYKKFASLLRVSKFSAFIQC